MKAYEVIPPHEQKRLLHETWQLAYDQQKFTGPASVADIAAWIIKAMYENSPVRVLTIMACLGYALDSEGHVIVRSV